MSDLNALLLDSVRKGKIKQAQRLLEEGADINFSVDRHGNNPLMLSIIEEDDDMMEFLLENDADATIKNKRGDSALTLVAKTTSDTEIMDILIEYGADINEHDSKGSTAIIISIENNDKEMLEWALKNKADFSSGFGDSGIFPLMLAVKMTNKPLVESLIKYGANVNQNDAYGNNVVHQAAYEIVVNEKKNAKEILDILYESGADLLHSNNDGETAVDYAKRYNHAALGAEIENKGLTYLTQKLLDEKQKREENNELEINTPSRKKRKRL